MRNYGQHNATLCGIRAARFETTVTIDDDLQHNPDDMRALLAKLEEGYDVVYGVCKQKLVARAARNTGKTCCGLGYARGYRARHDGVPTRFVRACVMASTVSTDPTCWWTYYSGGDLAVRGGAVE